MINIIPFVRQNITFPIHKGNRLYWCDAIKDRLYSVKLDGEDRREELFKQGSHFYDIMIHDDLMHITNWYGVGSRYETVKLMQYTGVI